MQDENIHEKELCSSQRYKQTDADIMQAPPGLCQIYMYTEMSHRIGERQIYNKAIPCFYLAMKKCKLSHFTDRQGIMVFSQVKICDHA